MANNDFLRALLNVATLGAGTEYERQQQLHDTVIEDMLSTISARKGREQREEEQFEQEKSLWPLIERSQKLSVASQELAMKGQELSNRAREIANATGNTELEQLVEQFDRQRTVWEREDQEYKRQQEMIPELDEYAREMRGLNQQAAEAEIDYKQALGMESYARTGQLMGRSKELDNYRKAAGFAQEMYEQRYKFYLDAANESKMPEDIRENEALSLPDKARLAAEHEVAERFGFFADDLDEVLAFGDATSDDTLADIIARQSIAGQQVNAMEGVPGQTPSGVANQRRFLNALLAPTTYSSGQKRSKTGMESKGIPWGVNRSKAYAQLQTVLRKQAAGLPLTEAERALLAQVRGGQSRMQNPMIAALLGAVTPPEPVNAPVVTPFVHPPW